MSSDCVLLLAASLTLASTSIFVLVKEIIAEDECRMVNFTRIKILYKLGTVDRR